MLSTLRLRVPATARYLSTSPITRTATGYGDPQDEKAANKTPTPNPSSQPDPYPKGNKSSGTTDPEVAGDKHVTEKEIKETKKIGKKPEKEEVGGAGVIGG